MRLTLLVLIGLPGSGKTTLSKWLADNSEFIVVSRDTIRAAMFPACKYSPAEKSAAFNAMQEAIRIALSQGVSVCTDGMTFASGKDRTAMEELARTEDAELRFAWCDAPVKLAQERISADLETVFPDRNPELVREVQRRFEQPPADSTHLDMTQPVEKVGLDLLAALGVA